MMDVHITLPPCLSRVCLLRRLLPFQSEDPSPRTRKISNKVRGCRQAPTGKNELAVASTALRVTPSQAALGPGRAARRQPAPDPARDRTHSLTRAGFFLKCTKITKFCLILGHITVYSSPAFWIAALGRRSTMLKIFFFANFQRKENRYFFNFFFKHVKKCYMFYVI